MNRSWRDLVSEIIDQLPAHFTLQDVLKHRAHLAKWYPANRHIDAKIRQTLQVLRDQGLIAFQSRGTYVRLRDKPRFSPLISLDLAASLTSNRQIARIVLETWAEFNLFCVHCETDSLVRLPANTPVADFACEGCTATYQLKGKDGRFGPVITGAAYRPMIDAVRAGTCPDYVLVEYDRRFSTVVFASAIAGPSITEDRIIERRALGAAARRAGWVGCNVRIAGLSKVALVEPAVVDTAVARAEWKEQSSR